MESNDEMTRHTAGGPWSMRSIGYLKDEMLEYGGCAGQGRWSHYGASSFDCLGVLSEMSGDCGKRSLGMLCRAQLECFLNDVTARATGHVPSACPAERI